MILSYGRNGYLPEAPFGLGFQLLAGSFEELGSGPFIALGWILFAVSLLDIVAIQLWIGHGRGAVLGIATSAVVFALESASRVRFSWLRPYSASPPLSPAGPVFGVKHEGTELTADTHL